MYENNDNNNYRVQNVGVFIVQRNNVNVNKQGSTFRKVCQQNGIYIKKIVLQNSGHRLMLCMYT